MKKSESVPMKLLLWTQKFEFEIIFICYKTSFSWIFFQPLSSWVVQRQSVAWVWPPGCSFQPGGRVTSYFVSICCVPGRVLSTRDSQRESFCPEEAYSWAGKRTCRQDWETQYQMLHSKGHSVTEDTSAFISLEEGYHFCCRWHSAKTWPVG